MAYVSSCIYVFITPGPCMFCGNLVCSPEEQEIISRESKKSKKLMEQLLSQKAQVSDIQVKIFEVKLFCK